MKELWNGILRGYHVGYRPGDRLSDSYVFNTYEIKETKNELQRLSLLIDNLQQFTKYSIVVQAFNSVGTGPKSNEILVMTQEGGKKKTSFKKIRFVKSCLFYLSHNIK